MASAVVVEAEAAVLLGDGAVAVQAGQQQGGRGASQTQLPPAVAATC